MSTSTAARVDMFRIFLSFAEHDATDQLSGENATSLTVCRWSASLLTAFQVAMSRSLIPGKHEASSRPSVESLTRPISPEWLVYVCKNVPVVVRRSFTVSSIQADATIRLSGDNTRWLILPEWPSSFQRPFPSLAH